MDDTHPSNMPDEVDELSEDERRDLIDRVFDGLCFESAPEGVSQIDVRVGCRDIALYSAKDREERDFILSSREFLFNHRDPRHKRIHRLLRQMEWALQSLVMSGRIEIIVEDGQPAYRIPNYEPFLHHLGKIGGAEPELVERIERRQQLRRMPYRDYLQSDEWRERRERHLVFAMRRCQLCNMSEQGRTLHVHHRSYERRGDELASDLIVLCADCHKWFHETRSRGIR